MTDKLKCFSGEGEQNAHQELKKFLKWAQGHMASKRMENEQRGPFLYSVLDGAALEAVDHLVVDMGNLNHALI